VIKFGFCSAACYQTVPCVLNCSTESVVRVDQSHKAGMTLHSLFMFSSYSYNSGMVTIGVVLHLP